MNRMMRQPTGRSAKDTEILNRVCVAIFKSAVGEASRLKLPAPANGSKRVGSSPAFFFQSIERERPLGASCHVGQLRDLEIIRPLLQLHKSFYAKGLCF